jgi:pyruvate dehydrogenase E2 component (dihydrolipoamide acetyltransferase)
MPKLGQTVEESTIVRWFKQEGDQISEGEILLEIETDKATLEVESFTSGTLLKILSSEGETVPVMETIAFIGDPDERVPAPDSDVVEPGDAPDTKAASDRQLIKNLEPKREPSEDKQSAEGAVLKTPGKPSPPEITGLLRITPRAARLARGKAIDPKPIQGTGPNGRIVESDVRAFLEEQRYDELEIIPAARDLASEHQIDLLSVRNRFGATRIDVSIVQQAIAEKPKPLPRIRQIIAQRLTESFRLAPHFYTTVSVDMTELLAFRAELKQRQVELTLNDFILKAVALTLREFPMVNSRTEDGKEVTWNSRVNLGLAVAIDDGLLVPVIFDADRLPLQSIHRLAGDLVERGRKRQLKPDEMSGSTFTISNMGMMDVENFTAVINPGESAILSVSSVIKKPVARDSQITIRSVMKMTLSADHRLIDGALAARFANAIKAKLEDLGLWESLL